MKVTNNISIVHIVGEATTSRIPRQVALLSREQKKRRHKVVVICPSGPLVKQLAVFGIECRVVAMKSLFDRAADHKIREALRSIAPRIVHCHGTKGGWLGRLAVRKLPNLAVVYTEHLWTNNQHLGNWVWEEFQLRGLRILDRFTDVTVAISEAVRSFLVKNRISSRHRVVVLPNMLDPRLMRLDCYKKPLTLPPLIGFVGSLNIQKGCIGLVDALGELRRMAPQLEWRCQIVGSGPLEKALRRRIRKHKLAERVVVKAGVPNATEVMRHFSCYVQSSRTEPSGLTTREAMALGVPPVVTDVGALPEIVKHGESGLVVPYGKTEKLAMALYEILHDRRRANRMGKTAQRFVRRNFDHKLLIDRLEAVYLKALRTRRFKNKDIL